jgi:hypothetical protein
MSSDLIGRRRASEQRLDRARSLELTLKEKTDILVATTGMTIEQLDFDGSFRAALTALAAVAARRTHFDVIVTLPDAPFAMRIQHVNDAVNAEVLIQRDGPFEPVSASTYPQPSSVAPAAPEPSPRTRRAEPAAAGNRYAEPSYAQPTHVQPAPKPTYLQPTHPQPSHSEPTYSQPSYARSSPPAQIAPAAQNAPAAQFSPPAQIAPAAQISAPAQISPAAPFSPSGQISPSASHPSASRPAASPALPVRQPAATYPVPTSWPPVPMLPAALPPAAPAPAPATSDYAASAGNHSESSGLSVSPGSAGVPDAPAMVQVASDLAELLWQGVDDMPS